MTYLKICGVHYRTKGAFWADIGSWGVKDEAGINMFNRKGMPDWGDALGVRLLTEAYQVETSTFLAKLLAPLGRTLADLGITVSTSGQTTGRFVVMGIPGVMDAVKQLNDPVNDELRATLRGIEKPRIVTSVAVAYDHEQVQRIGLGLSATALINPATSSGTGRWSLNLRLSNSTTLQLSDGTIFAYEFSKVSWEEDDTRSWIIDLVPDRPNLI